MRCEVKLGTCVVCFKKLFKNNTRKHSGRARNNETQYLEELDRDFVVEEDRENLMEMKNNFLGYGGILVKMWEKFSKSK